MRKSKLTLILAALLALLMVFATACSKDPDTDPGGETGGKTVADATITGRPTDDAQLFTAGATLQLGVKFYDGDGTELTGSDKPDAEWSSGTATVATVDGTGKVTHVASGSTKITVKAKGTTVTDSFTLTLTGIPTSLEVTGKPVETTEYPFGRTFDLAWQTNVAGDYEVAWTSSDEEATFVTAGSGKTATLHIGMKKAEATITATLAEYNLVSTFKVKAAGETAEPVDLAQFDWSVANAANRDGYDNVGQNRSTVTFENGKVKVASLPQSTQGYAGTLAYTGFKMNFPVGSFPAGARFTLSFKIDVAKKPTENAFIARQDIGDSGQVVCDPNLTQTNGQVVSGTFTSNGGNVLFFFWGNAPAYQELEYSVYDVTVTRKLVSGLEIAGKASFTDVQLTAGTKQIQTNAAGFTLHYASSDTSVAAVGNDGLLTLKKVGSAVITVALDGTVYTDTVTLAIVDTVDAVHIGGKPESNVYLADGTVQLSASVTPGNFPAGASYEWDSSVKTVATVNNSGLVTLIGAGATDITVKVKAGGVYLQSGDVDLIDTYTLTVQAVQLHIAQPISKVIDVKEGSVPVTLTIAEPSNTYTSGLVEWKLGSGVGSDVASVEAVTGVVTFSKAAYTKIAVELWYDSEKVDEMLFSAINSSTELVGTFTGTVAAATVSTDTPFGAASGYQVTENEGTATWHHGIFARQDGQNFAANTTYYILFDVRVLSNASTTDRCAIDGTVTSKEWLKLPTTPGDYTLHFNARKAAAAATMDFFVANGIANYSIVVSNIRIIELGSAAGATVNNAYTSNVVTGITDNAGVLPDGSIVFSFYGDGYTGTRGWIFNLAEGDYTISFDCTLYDLRLSDFWFNGFGNGVSPAGPPRITVDGTLPTFQSMGYYESGVTTYEHLSFNFSVTDSGTITFNMYLAAAMSGVIGVLSNIVITARA
ncbi:hypothetical protein FACS1894211_06100 [Clostridia bacterium]|nr:hypothetical protein FACS1894211_06100 [Clostridia bacterium]